MPRDLLRDGQRLLFYRGMANACRSGLSVLRALGLVAVGPLAPAARELERRVREGDAFSEAMKAQPLLFPQWHLELVAAAELTGRLDRAFETIADFIQERRAFIATVLGGLIYPLVLIHLAPMFLYAAMFYRGEYLQGALSVLQFFIYLYGAIGALGVAARLYGRLFNEPARVPGLGLIVKAHFCSTLNVMLGAGVSFPRAVIASAQASGLGQAALDEARRAEEGVSFVDRVERLGVFTAADLGRLAAAEASGTVDRELERIAQEAQLAGRAFVRGLAALLAPAAYVTILAVVGFQVIRFWSGYFGQIDGFMGMR